METSPKNKFLIRVPPKLIISSILYFGLCFSFSKGQCDDSCTNCYNSTWQSGHTC